jgi:hypothetical protein
MGSASATVTLRGMSARDRSARGRGVGGGVSGGECGPCWDWEHPVCLTVRRAAPGGAQQAGPAAAALDGRSSTPAPASPGARPMALAANAVEKSENTADSTVAPTISGKWRFMVSRWVYTRKPNDTMTTPSSDISRSPAPRGPAPCARAGGGGACRSGAG